MMLCAFAAENLILHHTVITAAWENNKVNEGLASCAGTNTISVDLAICKIAIIMLSLIELALMSMRTFAAERSAGCMFGDDIYS